MALDPRASETTPEEIAHAGPEEAGLESAFCRASENRPIAGYHAIMGRPANSSLEMQPSQSGRDRRTPEPKPGPPRGVHESSFSAAMPESSLRFRLVIARASDSTPGDVSGIVKRLHTDSELFWLLSVARPVAAAPKVCRRSVATCLALLMLDDHLRVLRVLPLASVPHTPGTGVLRRDGVIQTYLGGVLPPHAHAETKRITELLISGYSSYLDTLCRALSGDETPDGFEAVPADHELYDPEAERYFAPPLTFWYRAGVLVHPVVPSTGTT